MGWLSMPLAGMGGHRTAKAYLDAQFTYDRRDEHGHHRGLTVVASRCAGNRVYYAAVRPHGAADNSVFAVVCLVRWNPRASDGHVFAYKDMDETMGPCEAGCPAAILDLLGPTTNAHALAWRNRCREVLALRSRPIEAGMRIRLSAPLTFTDGHVGDEFLVEKQGRTLAFRDPGSGRRYRISHFGERAWAVVPRTRVHRTTFSRRDGLAAPERTP